MAEAGAAAIMDGDAFYSLLAAIEQRAITGAKGLPQERRIEVTWEGVLFTLAGERLVAGLDQIKEVLDYPDVVTRVPGTKSWIKGVANVRGDLLPLIDLEAFLWDRSGTIRRRSRVLVIEFEGQRAGLLVGEMVAIRHFSTGLRQEAPEGLDEVLLRFVTHAYALGGKLWPVFDMRQLAADPHFRVATA